MKLRVIVLVCVLWSGAAIAAAQQDLNQGLAGMADKLCKALAAQGYKNVAAVDFTDLQGQPIELGRFLSERLAVEMVFAGGVSMLDRANIKSILAEHKLTESGLVNPANAKKLGEFAGVDTILIGNVTLLDNGVELIVKAISTDTAKITAAGRISFPITKEIQSLLNRAISTTPGASGAAAAVGSAREGASYEDANAIAVKDLGSLRVALKSITPVKIRGNYSQLNGIRLSMEMTSRETQRPLVVAMNATQERGYNAGSCTLGQGLRASLVDSKGVIYTLTNSSVSGVSIIGVGCDYMTGYDPSEIASLLGRHDREGPRGQSKGEFVYGSLKTINPGETIRVSMTFVQDSRDAPSGPPPTSVQISSEIVIGVVTAERKATYSLQNLTFDRVTLAGGSH